MPALAICGRPPSPRDSIWFSTALDADCGLRSSSAAPAGPSFHVLRLPSFQGDSSVAPPPKEPLQVSSPAVAALGWGAAAGGLGTAQAKRVARPSRQCRRRRATRARPPREQSAAAGQPPTASGATRRRALVAVWRPELLRVPTGRAVGRAARAATGGAAAHR
uniref:Uncharacterized protein n=1 Tax=Setaria viridis TaxID=4556 RepID=A0A4U6V8C0_SETVI|nr:hypothetical protein SEVIR_3G045000v2 [Setaria viridis]